MIKMRTRREALPRDETLWIASHRDSPSSITQKGRFCQGQYLTFS